MYTQAGPQLRDELQRHHLPTYMVSFYLFVFYFFEHYLFFPFVSFCYKYAFSPFFLISLYDLEVQEAESFILFQLK